MDLLVALDTIRNISDDCLHSHATQTILTLRRVGQRLRHDLFAESPNFQTSLRAPPSASSPPQSPQSLQAIETFGSQSHRTVPSPPQSPPFFQPAGSSSFHTVDSRDFSSSSPQISALQVAAQPLLPPTNPVIPGREFPLSVDSSEANRALAPPDHVPDLLKRVKQSISWVWEVSQKEPSHIISRKQNIDEDLRLEHIRRVEGDRSLGNEDKFLRILALRSIAFDFTNEQIENKVFPTKLEELYNHALIPKPSRDNIFKYGSKDFSSKALSAGLKHMTLEKIITYRLKEHNLPHICDAISAVVGLHIDQFRRLRYDEMLKFADKLLSEDMHVQVSQRKMHFLDLVRDLTPWFNQLQNSYNFAYKSPISATESNRQKCPRPVQTIGTEIMSDFSANMGFTPNAHPRSGAESQTPGNCNGPEFAHVFYEQISTQPIDVSRIMDDITARACFDFENISPQHNFGL